MLSLQTICMMSAKLFFPLFPASQLMVAYHFLNSQQNKQRVSCKETLLIQEVDV